MPGAGLRSVSQAASALNAGAAGPPGYTEAQIYARYHFRP